MLSAVPPSSHRRSPAWPAWARFLHGGGASDTTVLREAPGPSCWLRPFATVWRPRTAVRSAARASVPVMADTAAAFHLQCFPLGEPGAIDRWRASACAAQRALSRELVTSFDHDGHLFLLFQRS